MSFARQLLRNFLHLPDVSLLGAAFEASERELFVSRFRGTFLVQGAAAVLLFAVVDHFLTPAQQIPLLVARGTIFPVAAACQLAYRNRFIRRHAYAWPALFSALYLGVLHAFLTSRSGGESSLHFMGLLLAIATMVSHLPWRERHLVWFALFLGGPFWVTFAFRWPQVNGAAALADALFFGSSLLLAIRHYGDTRRLRHADFVNHERLQALAREQADVIDRKTREGASLERLASQFSPQVIESIKSGALDLGSRSRRQIACIFVDVQNSTQRASRIEQDSYADLLAEFFEECVRIFLRHDVTVGTFLGDGILAFTNAPSENPRYRLNALNACLEILEFHRRHRKVYVDTWRAEFNIRIGMDCGPATVGFFPSRQHGTYTALGQTVSLAARLCAHAESNSIAVPRKFLMAPELAGMHDGALEIFPLTLATELKGLEGESFELFGVRPAAAPSTAEGACPDCGESLVPESKQVGATFFRCPACGYRGLTAA